jgi:hypothetical protein
MHRSFDRSGRGDNSIYRRWGIGFLVLPVLLAVTLFALAIVQPSTSNWIAETVQAEFIGNSILPEVAPTQLARPAPAMAIRTVRAN